MAKTVVYIKCSRSVQVTKPKVFLRDVASVFCGDEAVLIRCKEIMVYQFSKPKEHHAVISVIHLISLIEKEYPDVCVMSIGEVDVLVDCECGPKEKKWVSLFKVGVVCAICFCGTGYTIMAFHNDIGIHDMFDQIYTLAMGEVPTRINIMEIAYSIGLGLGIVVFFNHVGRLRLRKQPTPIEVSMKKYEDDVDRAMIEEAQRLKIVKEG